MTIKDGWIIITYLIMQFSGIIGFPFFQYLGFSEEQAVGWWLFFSFLVALLIILVLSRKDISERHIATKRVSRSKAAVWAFIGVFLALFAQGLAATIEVNLFGINQGSANTKVLLDIAKVTPIFIVVTSVIGPILEEIIFRKIIFGSLHKRFNFLISALISSLVFAAVHWEFEHILIYASMGLTFAYLYVKTKRLMVPIIAHVAMNTFVVIISLFADDIEKLGKQLETTQSFIGGFFS